MAIGKTLILAKNLSKSYSNTVALSKISVDFSESESVVIVGPNGSGKTTLIKCLTGIIQPSSGNISYPQHKNPNTIICGYSPENLTGFDFLTIREFLKLNFHLKNANSKNQKQTFDRCNQLKLSSFLNEFIKDLSKGNQQKASIISSLISNPKIVIIDEPTNGLDPLSQKELASIIKNYTQSGNLVISSSHQLNFSDSHATRYLILNNGKLLGNKTNSKKFSISAFLKTKLQHH